MFVLVRKYVVMRKIVPTILVATREEFEEKYAIASRFAPEIQIDILDNSLFHNTTVALRDIVSLNQDIVHEAHLMVNHPLEYLDNCKRLGIAKVVLHCESPGTSVATVQEFQKNGIKVSIAINPGTPVENLDIYLPVADGILVMSVRPGFQGQAFMHTALEKVKAIRSKDQDILISMDGGIKSDHLKEVFDAGATVALIGSGIFQAENPEETFREYERMAEK